MYKWNCRRVNDKLWSKANSYLRRQWMSNDDFLSWTTELIPGLYDGANPADCCQNSKSKASILSLSATRKKEQQEEKVYRPLYFAVIQPKSIKCDLRKS